MPDTNLDLAKLQESIDQLSESLGALSGVSAQASSAGTAMAGLTTTANSSSAAERAKAKVLEAASSRTRDGLASLAKAAGAAGAAMYNNQKGASAFNDTIDQGANALKAFGAALMLLGGPIGLVAGGLMMLVGSGAKLVKTINQQSDAVYKGFQDLSRSGGAASDGMTGLFADVQKLGLGFQDLGTLTSLIGESSKELALFGGSVSQGRKQFANMGQAMAPFRESLMNAGMTQEEINAASMGYLRLQTRIGQTQNKTADELANGARKYLIEQDALTKLTGMTRKEQEDAREEIRSQERFAAVLMEMRAKGQNAAAQELEDSYLILKSQSKEAAQGFADVSTGMLTTEAAQKSYLATQGESMRTAERIKAGELNAAQGAQRVAAAHGANADAMGASLGKMGVYNQTFGDLAADLRLKGMSEGDIEKQLAKIKQDQIDQGVTGKKAADGATQAQTDMRISQQKSMLALQAMINQGVEPVTSVMASLAKVVEHVTLGLTKLLNMLGMGPAKEKTKEEKQTDEALEKRKREVMDAEWKVVNARGEYDKKMAKAELEAAKRRQLDAEVAQKYAKDRATGAGAGPGGAQLRADGSVINRGDEDYVAPKPAAGGGSMDMPGVGAAAAAKVTGGASSGKMGSYNQPSGGPSAPSEVEGSQGPGLTAKAADVLDFTARSGSASAFEGLDSKVKSATIAAAEEYYKATGNKFKINSAKRDPADQQRLWDESVKLGTPGKGPTGMAVARPGRSPHEKGLAVDIQNYNDPAAVAAMNRQGLSQKVPGDPVHFSFGDGGIANGPTSGYLAELHGTEAVIPLKNGSVPVSLSMADSANMASNLGGNNQNLGLAEIINKMLPDISNDIGEKIKEINKNSESTTTSAIEQMTKDLKQSLTDAIKNIVPQDSGASAKQLELMSAMIREQQNSNSIQEKLLRAAAN